MTFRALGASILCMVLTAIYTNHTAIVVRETWTIPESVIPVPAILALLGLTLFTGLLAAVFKLRLLTRQEVVCVAFATLMSAPLMTQGFWLRFLGMIAATPMGQNFDYIDAFDDRLWPHGENLISASGARGAPPCGRAVLPRAAAASAAPLADTAGTASWRFGEIEEGRQGPILAITNLTPGEVSYAEYTFAAGEEAAPDFREPFLSSVLARG